MRILSTGLVLLVLNVAGAACAQAEVRQMPWEASPPSHVIEDRLRLEVNLWNMGIDTVLRSDQSPTQPGTTLDGETDLGLSDGDWMPNFELTLLPGQRHMIRFSGFSSRRSGTAVVARPFKYDGHNFLVGQTVNSTLNLDMLGVGYAYRLLKAPRYELDLGVDIQIASLDTSVTDIPPTFQSEKVDGVVPIPMPNIEARWEVWPRWQLQARYSWLGGSGDNGSVSGHMNDWRAGVLWQFSQHLAVGLDYRSFNVAVDSSSNSTPGALHLDYKGMQLGIRASL